MENRKAGLRALLSFLTDDEELHTLRVTEYHTERHETFHSGATMFPAREGNNGSRATELLNQESIRDAGERSVGIRYRRVASEEYQTTPSCWADPKTHGGKLA
jgi:hypothetical protein